MGRRSKKRQKQGPPNVWTQRQREAADRGCYLLVEGASVRVYDCLTRGRLLAVWYPGSGTALARGQSVPAPSFRDALTAATSARRP